MNPLTVGLIVVGAVALRLLFLGLQMAGNRTPLPRGLRAFLHGEHRR